MTKKDKRIIENAEAKGIPIFVLVAKDRVSRQTLADYAANCRIAGCKEEHLSEIRERITEFSEWQRNNPNELKLPD